MEKRPLTAAPCLLSPCAASVVGTARPRCGANARDVPWEYGATSIADAELTSPACPFFPQVLPLRRHCQHREPNGALVAGSIPPATSSSSVSARRTITFEADRTAALPPRQESNSIPNHITISVAAKSALLQQVRAAPSMQPRLSVSACFEAADCSSSRRRPFGKSARAAEPMSAAFRPAQ